jgi:hypothetical protein
MTDTTSQSNYYNDEDHNTDDYINQEFNVKRISIPIDKIKDFIQLIYGESEIIITRSVVSDNYLDLTNRNVMVL